MNSKMKNSLSFTNFIYKFCLILKGNIFFWLLYSNKNKNMVKILKEDSGLKTIIYQSEILDKTRLF